MVALEGYVADKLKPAKTKWERVEMASDLMQSNNTLFGEIVERYVVHNKAQFPKGTNKNYYHIKIVLGADEIEKIDGMRLAYKQIRKHSNPVQLGQHKPDRELLPAIKKNPKRATNSSADYREVWILDRRRTRLSLMMKKAMYLVAFVLR